MDVGASIPTSHEQDPSQVSGDPAKKRAGPIDPSGMSRLLQYLPFWLLVCWGLGTWWWIRHWLGEARHPLAFYWALSFSTVMAVLGPLVLAAWILSKQRQRRWPCTQGVVVAGGVRTLRRSKGRRTLQAELTVDYCVDGARHRAVCVPHKLGRVGSDALLSAHPIGSSLLVYHHPRHPGRAEIAPGLPVPLIAGLVGLGVGVPWVLTAVLWMVR